MKNMSFKQKGILFIFITLLSLPAKANPIADFFSDAFEELVDCITDPCNCGDNNPLVEEEWDGGVVRPDQKANRNCPPYNKRDGRIDGDSTKNCLLRDRDQWIVSEEMPFPVAPYYENICAQEAPESTYFEPKVRVRGQQCNAVACWSTNHLLNWNGECVTLASGYGVPLHRMCARIALPAIAQKGDPNNIGVDSSTGDIDYTEGRSADPGYTQNQHLNEEGKLIDDESFTLVDGSTFVPQKPKLCVYYDPAFLGSDGFDIHDLDPNSQPYHKGDLNASVSNKIYGCVEIPPGPMPPPFCPVIKETPQFSTQRICHINEYLDVDENGDPTGIGPAAGVPVESTIGNPCVKSTIRNNYIHNSVRVGYDYYVPLCANNPNTASIDPLVNFACVNLNSATPSLTASGMNTLTNSMNIIPRCGGGVTSGCIETGMACDADCQLNGGFRVVYAEVKGDKATPSPYYKSDMPDCPVTVNPGDIDQNPSCQIVWGVNIKPFRDVSVEFTQVQDNDDLSTEDTDITIDFNDNARYNFNVSVTRQTRTNSANHSQNSDQICAIAQGAGGTTMQPLLIGCEERAPHPEISTYECDFPGLPSGINCIANYFQPNFVISYRAPYKDAAGIDRLDTVYTIVRPWVYADSSSNNDPIYLIGSKFGSLVTDETLASAPFEQEIDLGALGTINNPLTKFGDYIDRNTGDPIAPYMPDPADPNEIIGNIDAIYVGGLQYLNGMYHIGGKYSCAVQLDQDVCPINPKACVLSDLLNSDMVSCKLWFEKIRDFPGIKRQSASDSGCSLIEDFGGTAPYVMKIKTCDAGYRYKITGGTAPDEGEELCELKHTVDQRIDPLPNMGSELEPYQYFRSNTASPAGTPGYNYAAESQMMRTKTPLEWGLCVEVRTNGATCPERTAQGADDGYANWPETLPGEVSIGTCPPGKVPEGEPLERYCVPDPVARDFNLNEIPVIDDDTDPNDGEPVMRCVTPPPTTP